MMPSFSCVVWRRFAWRGVVVSEWQSYARRVDGIHGAAYTKALK